MLLAVDRQQRLSTPKRHATQLTSPHLHGAEATNSRVAILNIAAALMCIGFCCWQLWYLNKVRTRVVGGGGCRDGADGLLPDAFCAAGHCCNCGVVLASSTCSFCCPSLQFFKRKKVL